MGRGANFGSADRAAAGGGVAGEGRAGFDHPARAAACVRGGASAAWIAGVVSRRAGGISGGACNRGRGGGGRYRAAGGSCARGSRICGCRAAGRGVGEAERTGDGVGVAEDGAAVVLVARALLRAASTILSTRWGLTVGEKRRQECRR